MRGLNYYFEDPSGNCLAPDLHEFRYTIYPCDRSTDQSFRFIKSRGLADRLTLSPTRQFPPLVVGTGLMTLQSVTLWPISETISEIFACPMPLLLNGLVHRAKPQEVSRENRTRWWLD